MSTKRESNYQIVINYKVTISTERVETFIINVELKMLVLMETNKIQNELHFTGYIQNIYMMPFPVAISSIKNWSSCCEKDKETCLQYAFVVGWSEEQLGLDKAIPTDLEFCNMEYFRCWCAFFSAVKFKNLGS